MLSKLFVSPLAEEEFFLDNDNTGIFHVFELRIGKNEFDHRSFYRCLSLGKIISQSVRCRH